MPTRVPTGRRRTEPLIDALAGIYILPDTGCSASPSCFTCPLPECRYADPVRFRTQEQDQRTAEVRALLDQGLTHQAAAARLGLSLRTIARHR